MRYGFCAAMTAKARPPLAARVVAAPSRATAVATFRSTLAHPAGGSRACWRAVPLATVATRTHLAPGAAPRADVGPVALGNGGFPPPRAGPAAGSAAILSLPKRLSLFGLGGSPAGWQTLHGRASASFSRRLRDLLPIRPTQDLAESGGERDRRHCREPEPPAAPVLQNQIQRRFLPKPRRWCTDRG